MQSRCVTMLLHRDKVVLWESEKNSESLYLVPRNLGPSKGHFRTCKERNLSFLKRGIKTQRTSFHDEKARSSCSWLVAYLICRAIWHIGSSPESFQAVSEIACWCVTVQSLPRIQLHFAWGKLSQGVFGLWGFWSLLSWGGCWSFKFWCSWFGSLLGFLLLLCRCCTKSELNPEFSWFLCTT